MPAGGRLYYLLCLLIAMEPIDLEKFRLTADIEPRSHSLAPRRRKSDSAWFLRGPIQGDWLSRAAALPGRALHVALAIRHGIDLAKPDQAHRRSTREIRGETGRGAAWTPAA